MTNFIHETAGIGGHRAGGLTREPFAAIGRRPAAVAEALR
jgi:hypothetical protein